MKAYSGRLVQYVINDVETQAPLNLCHGERPLVLVAHDEMTAQANDARAKSWVFEDQHALRKKGVGRGIHKSDIICSTVGRLKDASQTLEYRKNYEGYWTGELFVKQVRTRQQNIWAETNVMSHSSLRKSFLPSKRHMDPFTKRSSWWIILKVTRLMQLMLWLCRG